VSARPVGERGGTVDDAAEKAEGPAEPSAPSHESAVDALLRQVDEPRMAAAPVPAPVPVPAPAPVPSLRTARLIASQGRAAKIAWRGSSEAIDAVVAPEVDPQLVARAAARSDAVLVEHAPNERPLIVGVVQTRIPDEVEINARVIRLNAEHEILLRSGTGAVRIREDGDIEIVGSRIAASSRGLFRLVGRILRLN
jgi:hypothetical protein